MSSGLPALTVRDVGLLKSSSIGGQSKKELRILAREYGLDSTHLGEPPATYPKGAHEGDKVSIKANLCCSAGLWQDCEGYVKFIREGVETRIPADGHYDIPKGSCRWSPTYTFIMPGYDEIITIEPWEHDPVNPDDRGGPVDITIKYVPPGEALPGKDPLDAFIIWFESTRPKCFIPPLESLISGGATFIIKVTPKIPLLPGG